MTVLQAIGFLASQASTANALNLAAVVQPGSHVVPTHEPAWDVSKCGARPLVFEEITHVTKHWMGAKKSDVVFSAMVCGKRHELSYHEAKETSKRFEVQLGGHMTTQKGMKGIVKRGQKKPYEKAVKAWFAKVNNCPAESCAATRKEIVTAIHELTIDAELESLKITMRKTFRSTFAEETRKAQEATTAVLEKAKSVVPVGFEGLALAPASKPAGPPLEPLERFKAAGKKVRVMLRVTEIAKQHAAEAAARRQYLLPDEQVLSEFYSIVHKDLKMVIATKDIPTFHKEYTKTLDEHKAKFAAMETKTFGEDSLARFDAEHAPLKVTTPEGFVALKGVVIQAGGKIMDQQIRKSNASAELETTHRVLREQLAKLKQNEEQQVASDMEDKVAEQMDSLANTSVGELHGDDAGVMAAAAGAFLENPVEVVTGLMSFEDIADGVSVSTAAKIGGSIIINKTMDHAEKTGIKKVMKSAYANKNKKLQAAKEVAAAEIMNAFMSQELDPSVAADDEVANERFGSNMLGQANLLKALAKLDQAEKDIEANKIKQAEVEKKVRVAAEYLRIFLKFTLNVCTKLSSVVDPTSPITWAVVAVLSLTPIGPLGPLIVLPIVALVSFGLSKLLGFLARKLVARLSRTELGKRVLSGSLGAVTAFQTASGGVGGMIESGIENAFSTAYNVTGAKMTQVAGVISQKSSASMTRFRNDCPECMAYVDDMKKDGAKKIDKLGDLGKGMLISATSWGRKMTGRNEPAPTQEQIEAAITYERLVSNAVGNPQGVNDSLQKLQELVGQETAQKVKQRVAAAGF